MKLAAVEFNDDCTVLVTVDGVETYPCLRFLPKRAGERIDRDWCRACGFHKKGHEIAMELRKIAGH